MSWLVCACGALLALAGAVSVLSGAPYIRMEFGWTEVIAGTTAFTGGLVIVALGAVLHRLKAMQTALAGRSAVPERPALPPRPAVVPPDVEAAPPSLDPEVVPASPEPRPPQRPDAEPPPRRSLLTRLGPRRGETMPPQTAVAVPVEPVAVNPATEAVPEPPPAVTAPTGTPFHRVGVEDVAVQEESPPGDGEAGREVVGRYEAGGASYALFSDGTIEVTTANGSRRFGSMEELRAYVESQDADRVAPAP